MIVDFITSVSIFSTILRVSKKIKGLVGIVGTLLTTFLQTLEGLV